MVCRKYVRTIKQHTLPTNVISNELGIFLEPKTEPAFRPWQHSTHDLVGTIGQYSNAMINSDVEETRARYQLALTSFQKWDGPVDVMKSKTQLQSYFRTIDNLLFAASLQPYTKVQFSTPLKYSRSSGKTFLSHKYTAKDPEVHIHITELDPLYEAAPDYQGKALLGTLLHEMVHAFLLLFHCHCPCCLDDHITTIGITGHGEAFETLTKEIGRFTSKYLNQLEIQGLEDDIHSELVALQKYTYASLLRSDAVDANCDLREALRTSND